MSPPNSHADSRTSSAVPALLAGARRQQSESLGQLLQMYRNYLTILATTQLDHRLRRRLSPSDIVQETMLAANRDFQQFRGNSEPELLSWLRQILIRCLYRADEVHFKARRRDVRCEISLDQVCQAMDQSAVQLVQMLPDRGASPSAHATQAEQSVLLANQLAKLRPAYRDVIVLRVLHGLSFDEVAERMGRKPQSIRMLWLRAIEKFREVYEPTE